MHFVINNMHIVSGHRIDHIFVGGVHIAHIAALLEYNNSIRESILTAMHPHKWWSTLKTLLFGVIFSLFY